MRGYDLIGPWYAKFINNNSTGRGFGELAAKYYTNLYQNKPPTLKQKIVLKYIGGNLRPFVRLAGWILTKLKK